MWHSCIPKYIKTKQNIFNGGHVLYSRSGINTVQQVKEKSFEPCHDLAMKSSERPVGCGRGRLGVVAFVCESSYSVYSVISSSVLARTQHMLSHCTSIPPVCRNHFTTPAGEQLFRQSDSSHSESWNGCIIMLKGKQVCLYEVLLAGVYQSDKVNW